MSADRFQSFTVFPEISRTKMMMGHGFLPETFYMDEMAIILMGGITLAAHAGGAVPLQGFKIIINDIQYFFLLARRHGEGHDIPYHNEWGFGLHSR